MIEVRLTLTRTIDLKRALAPLKSLVPTAILIYSDGAIFLLATHPDRHLIASLQIFSLAVGISATAGLDIVKLYNSLNSSHDLWPVTIHARDNEDKFILRFCDIGITTYRRLTTRLIRRNAEHLIFMDQIRIYDVRIWMTSAEFRSIVIFLAGMSPKTGRESLISTGEGIVFADQVWFFASDSAPPMLRFPVPPIGDIAYHFV